LPVNSNTNLIEALFHLDNDIGRLLKIIDDEPLYSPVFRETIDMLQARLCETSTVAMAPEFRRLCDRSLLKMRFFEADGVLKLFKCLSIIDLPEDTLLVWAVCSNGPRALKDLTIKELGALSHSLEMFHPIIESSKSRIKALKAAIARKNQIEAKLTHETERPINSDRVLLRDHRGTLESFQMIISSLRTVDYTSPCSWQILPIYIHVMASGSTLLFLGSPV